MTSRRDTSWRNNREVYALPDGNSRPTAVYIHVPFCAHRCGYCDFTLVAGRDDLVDRYLVAVENELHQIAETCPVDSLFVGGGTPTQLTAEQLGRLLSSVRSVFPLRPGAEVSVEANPDGLSEEKLAVLAEGGMNRLSLGVQSFDLSVLQTLERTHTPEQACGVVQLAQQFVDRISVDLIFGVPGQSHAVWKDTLQTAAALPVQHVSTYGLTYEPGTAFHRRRTGGDLYPMRSEDERQQYATAITMLPEFGYEQYEISNFAQSDFRCRHNQVYWDAGEYFAFGPGAARYVNGVRSTNSRNVMRWIESWEQTIPLLHEVEQLSAEDRAREAVMLGLRCNEGIVLQRFEERFGCSVASLAPDAMQRHLDGRLLEFDDARSTLRLTDEGRFLADSVIADFL